jgi:hypothetical protein
MASRSIIRRNTITSKSRMSFGLSTGAHPWKQHTIAYNGTVSGNTVSGAIVNLMVDGVDGVTIRANSLSSPTVHPSVGNVTGSQPITLWGMP